MSPSWTTNNLGRCSPKYKLERIDVLRREFGDVEKAIDVIVGKGARTLDGELPQHKFAPLPALSALDRARPRPRGGPR